MRSALVVLLTLPSYPVGLRRLVFVLIAGWLVASLGSVAFLLAISWRAAAAPRPLSWLLVGAVLLLGTAGYAALARAHRWTGVLLLLGACGLGAGLLYLTRMAFALSSMIYGT